MKLTIKVLSTESDTTKEIDSNGPLNVTAHDDSTLVVMVQEDWGKFNFTMNGDLQEVLPANDFLKDARSIVVKPLAKSLICGKGNGSIQVASDNGRSVRINVTIQTSAKTQKIIDYQPGGRFYRDHTPLVVWGLLVPAGIIVASLVWWYLMW